jgi:hypothetical protein
MFSFDLVEHSEHLKIFQMTHLKLTYVYISYPVERFAIFDKIDSSTGACVK